MQLFLNIAHKLFRIPDKDPTDYTKSFSSTHWIYDSYYCTACKCTTGHTQYMTDICNHCGSFCTQVLYGRSYRKIKLDGKWKYQVKYRNGNEEIIEKWYRN